MAKAIPADIATLIAANPGIGRDRLARIAQISPRQARRALERARGLSPKPTTPLPDARPAVGVLTLAAIRAKYDVTEKIRMGVKEHLIGKDAFVEDARFRELCGVHINNWRRHASLPEFSDYQVKLSGVVHWASAANVTKVRQLTGIV